MNKPTIKGIFVNSHIKAVRAKKGEEGIRELKKLSQMDLNFKNFENVLVRDEVKIIKYALKVIADKEILKKDIEFEAGKLHFRNFSKTPFGRIIFSQFRKNFKLLIMKSQHIAGHVFKGVKFTSKDLGLKSAKVIMENNDYHIDHFRGLFQEWMNFAGLKGTVKAKEVDKNTYEYTMSWK